jgi:DNA-binding NtrC family response regulator
MNPFPQKKLESYLPRRAILTLLRAFEWNQSQAADALGVSEKALREAMKNANLQLDSMKKNHLPPPAAPPFMEEGGI